MEHVLFIINPVSGGLDKEQVLEQIDLKFTDQGYTIFQTTGDNDKEKICSLADSLSLKTIVAGGGDGTIAMIADVIKKKAVPLGILPLGSANGLATELEIPKELEESLDLIKYGKPKPFDLIEINETWNVLHLADLGLNATLVRRYQEDEHRGFLGYALSALKELPNIDEPMTLEIVADGETYNFESRYLGIANAKKYGTGIVINPEGKVDDGKFELCILNELSFRNVLENFIGEQPQEPGPFTVISAEKATIRLSPQTDFQIDGEYMGEVQALDVKVSGSKLRIIY